MGDAGGVPDSDRLHQFLLGTLPEADCPAVEDFVERSPAAAETLARMLPVTDTLIVAVSNSPQIPEPPAEVRELADTVKRRSLGEPEKTLLSGAQGLDSAYSDDWPAILAPAESAEELGRLGDYRVFRILGRGGMGVVFDAEDVRLHRRVALKVVSTSIAQNPNAKARFFREARAAAAVEHDNVIVIYQVGEDRGLPFLAMPLLQGETLADRLQRERRLPAAEVIRIGREIAAGLAAAHERGLIHRDIKPANLWLDWRSGRVKILDFGLARDLVALDEPSLTQSGAIVGTPHFMAPEQAEGL
ncbi:MAG: hypothetical protein B7Z55_17155, partial [Planctomycetales bacterium 12-60-4]